MANLFQLHTVKKNNNNNKKNNGNKSGSKVATHLPSNYSKKKKNLNWFTEKFVLFFLKNRYLQIQFHIFDQSLIKYLIIANVQSISVKLTKSMSTECLHIYSINGT